MESGIIRRPTEWSFPCSEIVKLESTYLLVGQNLTFVFGMWDKNHYSEQNQMEASDLDLQSDQDSKFKKRKKKSHSRVMVENSATFKENKHGSPLITPFDSPVHSHSLQKQSGSCHIKCVPQN